MYERCGKKAHHPRVRSKHENSPGVFPLTDAALGDNGRQHGAQWDPTMGVRPVSNRESHKIFGKKAKVRKFDIGEIPGRIRRGFRSKYTSLSAVARVPGKARRTLQRYKLDMPEVQADPVDKVIILNANITERSLFVLCTHRVFHVVYDEPPDLCVCADVDWLAPGAIIILPICVCLPFNISRAYQRITP